MAKVDSTAQEIDDLRVQLDENRAFMVRALRAVDVATSECREEAKNASARVVHLEAALSAQNELLVLLRSQLIETKANQDPVALAKKLSYLEEKMDREISSTFQAALKSQQDSRLSVLAELKALSRRLDGLDATTVIGSKEYEASVNSMRNSNVEVIQKLQKMETEFSRLSQSVIDHESSTKKSMHATEVRHDAQLTNSDALTALRLNELEQSLGDTSRGLDLLRHQAAQHRQEVSPDILQQLQNRVSALHLQQESFQSTITATQQDVSNLKDQAEQSASKYEDSLADFRSNYVETKCEIDSMFKGEMLLSQRVNDLQVVFNEKIDSLNTDLSARLENNKCDDKLQSINVRFEMLELQTSDLSAGVENLCSWVKGSLQQREDEFKKELSKSLMDMRRDLELVFNDKILRTDKEISANRSVCEHMWEKLISDSQQMRQRTDEKVLNQAGIIDDLKINLNAIMQGMKILQDESIRGSENLQQALESFSQLQQRHEVLKDSVHTLTKDGILVTDSIDQVKSELHVSVEGTRVKLNDCLSRFGQLQEDVRYLLASKADSKDVKEIVEKLENIKSQAKETLGTIAAIQSSSGPARSDQVQETIDLWSLEGRVTKVELAMIEVLEKETEKGFRESTRLLEERLESTERASSQIFTGISRLSETIDSMMITQKQLDDQTRRLPQRPSETLRVGASDMNESDTIPKNEVILRDMRNDMDVLKAKANDDGHRFIELKTDFESLKDLVRKEAMSWNETRIELEAHKSKAKHEDSGTVKGKVNLEALKARAMSEDLGVSEIKSELDTLKGIVAANRIFSEQQSSEQEKQISLSNMAMELELQNMLQSHIQQMRTDLDEMKDAFRMKTAQLDDKSKNDAASLGSISQIQDISKQLTAACENVERLRTDVDKIVEDLRLAVDHQKLQQKDMDTLKTDLSRCTEDYTLQIKALASAIAETNQIQEAMALDEENKEQSRIQEAVVTCRELVCVDLRPEMKLYIDSCISTLGNRGETTKKVSDDDEGSIQGRKEVLSLQIDMEGKLQLIQKDIEGLDNRLVADIHNIKNELKRQTDDIVKKFNGLASAIAETNQIQESMAFDISTLASKQENGFVTRDYVDKVMHPMIVSCRGQIQEFTGSFCKQAEEIMQYVSDYGQQAKSNSSGINPSIINQMVHDTCEKVVEYLENVMKSDLAQCSLHVKEVADTLLQHNDTVIKLKTEQDALRQDLADYTETSKQDGRIQRFVDRTVTLPLENCQLQVRDLAKALSEVIANQRESMEHLASEQIQLAKRSDLQDQISSLTNELEDIKHTLIDVNSPDKQRNTNNESEHVSVQDFDNLQEDFQILQDEVKTLSVKVPTLATLDDLQKLVKLIPVEEARKKIFDDLPANGPQKPALNQNGLAINHQEPTADSVEVDSDSSSDLDQLFAASSNGSARIKALAAQVRGDTTNQSKGTAPATSADRDRNATLSPSWSDGQIKQDPVHLQFV